MRAHGSSQIRNASSLDSIEAFVEAEHVAFCPGKAVSLAEQVGEISLT